MRWYVSQNGKTLGPFREERLSMLLEWGKISRDAYICDEQWSTWIAITRSAFAPRLSPPGAGPSRPPPNASESAVWPGLHRVVFAGLMLVGVGLTVVGSLSQQRGAAQLERSAGCLEASNADGCAERMSMSEGSADELERRPRD